MKQLFFKASMAAFIFSAAFGITSCKTKVKETTTPTPTVNYDSSNAVNNAPVVVSPDETLMQGVKDATKDHPGVTVSVNNGEVTLTGTIERSKLANLMQSIQGLSPKKINNNLKIK